MVEIKDNFLAQHIFDDLENLMMYPDIDWHYQDRIDGPDEDGAIFQFCHIFYQLPNITSDCLRTLEPVLDTLLPLSLYRIKANLLTKTPKIIPNTFHQDMLGMTDRIKKQWTTSILYMNTNNGYTEFKDGTKVESVANRFVSFPADTWHRGTSCTDQNTRVVINFNYFAYESDDDIATGN